VVGLVDLDAADEDLAALGAPPRVPARQPLDRGRRRRRLGGRDRRRHDNRGSFASGQREQRSLPGKCRTASPGAPSSAPLAPLPLLAGVIGAFGVSFDLGGVEPGVLEPALGVELSLIGEVRRRGVGALAEDQDRSRVDAIAERDCRDVRMTGDAVAALEPAGRWV
jgi:hypothetical protein